VLKRKADELLENDRERAAKKTKTAGENCLLLVVFAF